MSLGVHINLKTESFQTAVKLDIELHGVTAVFGPSGCGKTSLLRAISGLDKYADSTVFFGDECWQNDSSFLPTYKRGLSYVFQEPSLFTHLSVEQNLDFALQRSDSVLNDQFVDKSQVIDLLNISHLRKRTCGTLSGGERQRVSIARALCAQPRLLLMDEPLSALDAGHKAEIIPLLDDVCRHSFVPIIYVSHSVDEVARFAHNIVLMAQGQVLKHGKTAQVLSQLDLPIAQQSDAASIIDGHVYSHEPEFAMTHLDTPAGRLCITNAAHLNVGTAVRVKLSARDISIAFENSAKSSILNALPAILVEMREQNNAQILLKLNANGVPILAKITKKSSHILKLTVGQSVVLQIKSVALL